jgi:two-component system chemotaxis response regulator CheB
LRFRCQVGHGYTGEALANEQEGSIDEAFRIVVRIIGERAVLMDKMSIDANKAGRTAAAATFDSRAQEYRSSAKVLMDAALENGDGVTPFAKGSPRR